MSAHEVPLITTEQLMHSRKDLAPDAAGLEQALRASVEGEVRFDAGSRAWCWTTCGMPPSNTA
jgi:hypothetical protein